MPYLANVLFVIYGSNTVINGSANVVYIFSTVVDIAISPSPPTPLPPPPLPRWLVKLV